MSQPMSCCAVSHLALGSNHSKAVPELLCDVGRSEAHLRRRSAVMRCGRAARGIGGSSGMVLSAGFVASRFPEMTASAQSLARVRAAIGTKMLSPPHSGGSLDRIACKDRGTRQCVKNKCQVQNQPSKNEEELWEHMNCTVCSLSLRCPELLVL